MGGGGQDGWEGKKKREPIKQEEARAGKIFTNSVFKKITDNKRTKLETINCEGMRDSPHRRCNVRRGQLFNKPIPPIRCPVTLLRANLKHTGANWIFHIRIWFWIILLCCVHINRSRKKGYRWLKVKEYSVKKCKATVVFQIMYFFLNIP